jgi:hypothetical protein
MFAIRHSDTVTRALAEGIGREKRSRALSAAVAELLGASPLSADLVVLTATSPGEWRWALLTGAMSGTIEAHVVVLSASQPELLEAYVYWRAEDRASRETHNSALCLLIAHDAASGSALIQAARRTFERNADETQTEEGIVDLESDDSEEDDLQSATESESEESDEDSESDDEDGDDPSASAEGPMQMPMQMPMQIVPHTAPTEALSVYDLAQIGGYKGKNQRAALALAKTIQRLEEESKNIKAQTTNAKALVAARAVIPDTEEPLSTQQAEAAARAVVAKLGTGPPVKLITAVTAALEANPDELADMLESAAKQQMKECKTVASMLDPTQAPLKDQEAIERARLERMLAQITKLETQIGAHERANKSTPTDALSAALRELRARRDDLARQEAHTVATIDRLVEAQRPTLTSSAAALGVTDQWAACLNVPSPESLEEIESLVAAAWRKAVLPVHPDKMGQAEPEAKAEAKAAYDRLEAARAVLLARIAEVKATLTAAEVPLRSRAAKRKAAELERERD